MPPAGSGSGVRRPIFTFAVPGLRTYFTSKRAGLNGDVTSALADFIAASRQSLDCAIYDLRDVEVLAALRRVMRRGCRVRIAFDAGDDPPPKPGADPKPGGTEGALDEFGLLANSRKIRRTSKTYLHHKFIVRDGRSVWTGTGNFTPGAFQLQDNNWVVVRSPQLARRYEAAFGLIWAQPAQAAAAAAPRHRRIDDVPGAWIWPFFEPSAGLRVRNAITRALARATKVRMMAFELSDPEIIDALRRFARPDADIRGIYDINGMKDALEWVRSPDPERYWWYGTGDPRFVGVPSHPFGTLPGGLNDFHHLKTFILDDRTVITGSYNFSVSAQTNGEDVLFIDSPAMAGAYRRYFRRLFAHYTASGGG